MSELLICHACSKPYKTARGLEKHITEKHTPQPVDAEAIDCPTADTNPMLKFTKKDYESVLSAAKSTKSKPLAADYFSPLTLDELKKIVSKDTLIAGTRSWIAGSAGHDMTPALKRLSKVDLQSLFTEIYPADKELCKLSKAAILTKYI